MEILDIYDSNRMPTGRTFVRGTKPEGGYYLVAQVIVFNTKGQMLIQQRQAHKLGWPNRWDVSAGGSVPGWVVFVTVIFMLLPPQISFRCSILRRIPSQHWWNVAFSSGVRKRSLRISSEIRLATFAQFS